MRHKLQFHPKLRFEVIQMAEKSVPETRDVLKEFHQILKRCCKLEDTLLENVGLLNCIKNGEVDASKELEKSRENLQALRQKTDALDSKMKKLTAKDFLSKGIDLEGLEKRCTDTTKIYEQNKEKFEQLLKEIEKEKCGECS